MLCAWQQNGNRKVVAHRLGKKNLPCNEHACMPCKEKNMQVWHGYLENEWHVTVAYMPCKGEKTCRFGMAVLKMNGMPEWHTCHVKKKNMQVWPGCLENEWHVTRIKTLNKNLHRHPSNGNIVKNDITFFMWLMGQKGAKLL